MKRTKNFGSMILGVVLVLFLCSFTDGQVTQTFKSKSDITGWDKVDFGMTLGQVIKQYPNSFKDTTTNCIEGIIQIQTPVRFDEHICNVSFFFLDSRLVSVSIIVYTDFDTIESEFIARYGGQKRPMKWDNYKPLVQTTWVGEHGKIIMMPNYVQFSRI